MKKLGDPLALFFDWPVRHVVHLGLPLAVIVSALAHIGGLLAFKLAPIPPRDLLFRSAHVDFLPAGLARADRLALAIEADDPSLFSPSAVEESTLWNLSATRYVPSFEGWQASFRVPPPREFSGLPHVARSTPVRSRQESFPSGDPAHVAIPPTAVTLSGGLEGLDFHPPTEVSYTAPRRQSLSPSDFLVAVDPDGLVLHAFVISSSGNEALDRFATQTLLRGRFEGSKATAPVWGVATFLWGSDVKPLPSE